MCSTKVLFLISFLLLLNVQPSSPSNIGLKLVDSLRRRLLQATREWTTKTPENTHLKLCETDVCDSRRPDGPRGEGLCDRWARGEQCPEEQIFHVWGDPGSNDKAEMFFNLRSPWNVSCEKGTCTPSLGAVYNVYVAEGCIPERDYISEMQDTSERVSKQVKIYLRRKAEFFITVQRRPGVVAGPNSNCSFGMTVGSIEALSDSAKCYDVRRIKRGEAAAANIPNCREIMPQYQSFQQPDTSAQATFVVALIGLGVLVLALLVLGGVLLRRWGRRKAQKAKDLESEFGGVAPGGTTASAALEMAAAAQPAETSQSIVVDVEPPEPREEDEPRRKQRAPGVRTREDRQRLEKRMMQIEDGVSDEDDVDQGELGANAGVLEGRGSSQLRTGRGGSKLVMGGGKVSASRATDRPGSGSSGSGMSEGGRNSPADELYRSRLTARLVPGSPGGSRVPTPPEASQGPRGRAPRPAPGSRGSGVAGDDIEFRLKSRPETASSGGSGADWEDNTGIRIDDILAQARGAAAAAAGGKATPDRSRAWKVGDRSPVPSGSGSSGSGDSKPKGAASQLRAPSTSSSGSGDGASAGAATRQPALAQQQPPAQAQTRIQQAPAPKAPQGADGRPVRPPVMAPLMAARLGIKPQQAIGGRAMVPLGSKQLSPSKEEPANAPVTRTVMLQAIAHRKAADLPVAGQAGVPLPPPRNGAMPPPRAIGAADVNLNGHSNPSPTDGVGRPPVGGAASAWQSLESLASTPTTGPTRPQPGRPALGGGALQRGGENGVNGRDGRGMARLGGRRGAVEEQVLEELDD